MLRNSQGLPVMGNDGPIALPALQAIEIGIDGTLSIVAQGQGPEAMVEIDRIKLVNPELQNMTKGEDGDRKSTRLNSSHVAISYAVFCLKKKNNHYKRH